MSQMGLVSRVTPVHTAKRNCMRGGGEPFELGNQVPISTTASCCRLKAMLVPCQEGVRAPCCMRDEGRPFEVAF